MYSEMNTKIFTVAKGGKYWVSPCVLAPAVLHYSTFLYIIKVLKLYGWEPSFHKKIEGIRDEELTYMKDANYLSAWSGMLWNTSTYLVN